MIFKRNDFDALQYLMLFVLHQSLDAFLSTLFYMNIFKCRLIKRAAFFLRLISWITKYKFFWQNYNMTKIWQLSMSGIYFLQRGIAIRTKKRLICHFHVCEKTTVFCVVLFLYCWSCSYQEEHWLFNLPIVLYVFARRTKNTSCTAW